MENYTKKYYVDATDDAQSAMDILDSNDKKKLSDSEELALLRRVYSGLMWEGLS